MKRIFEQLLLAAALVMAVTCTSCEESLSPESVQCTTRVVVNLPADMPECSLQQETYEFLNVSTGSLITSESGTVTLTSGIYDVRYEAVCNSTDGRKLKVRAFRQSCILTDAENTLILDANLLADTDDLIIVEVFFTGTQQSSGNSYNGDDYVKLYNNTDHVIYADGITLFESKFNTTEKCDYTPNIMSHAMTVQALYTVPGNGTEHPVQPGEYFLLADTGIDHRVANPNSFDLSHADFEWYDISSSPSNLDIDSPSVPNLDKWYCYTLSYWILHNRGYKAYGIARIPVDKESYLKDYYYSYEYELVTAVGTFPMDGNAYKLPNEWIVDVVNCSVASEYAWNLCDPSLDCGWTSCGTIGNDKNRFFKAVRRKLLYVEDSGRPVFKDTNNSTEDFNASVVPSEIELQGTVKSLDGSRATQVTYDGITPIAR